VQFSAVPRVHISEATVFFGQVQGRICMPENIGKFEHNNNNHNNNHNHKHNQQTQQQPQQQQQEEEEEK
jgi:hypothetical protein